MHETFMIELRDNIIGILITIVPFLYIFYLFVKRLGYGKEFNQYMKDEYGEDYDKIPQLADL